MSNNEKHVKLKEILKDYGKVAVAFSSGVDSTFLLKVAHDVLGDNAIAITIESSLYPVRETAEAIHFCEELGIKQIMVHSDEFEIEGFDKNPIDRCYICKKHIFGKIKEEAEKEGIEIVVEGSNVDDEGDYRPGMRAIEELDVKSPLLEARLTKHEIRALSRDLLLQTWNKPSFACLATRFAYGDTITEEKLSMVNRAEQYLLNLGFTQNRVRVHGEDGMQARIELLPRDFAKILDEETRTNIYSELKDIGFENISLDLRGYTTGSMNKSLL